ncbi:MAG: hypothetical protein ACFE9X_03155 [Promethearchaeota archaeon]
MIDSFSVYIAPSEGSILFLILFMKAIITASGFIIVLVYQTNNPGDFLRNIEG